MTKKIWTGNSARETAGVGSVINTHHEGSRESRPTERICDGLDHLDAYTPPVAKRKTIADFFREKAERQRLAKEAENRGERE